MDNVLFRRRRESVKRKEQEDIIESSTIGGAIKRTGRAIADSTRGFMGRLFDFVGIIIVGWLVNNLPKIIDQAQGLIRRVTQVGRILGAFVYRVNLFLQGIWSVSYTHLTLPTKA